MQNFIAIYELHGVNPKIRKVILASEEMIPKSVNKLLSVFLF